MDSVNASERLSQWLPLVEYSVRTGISTSTLRRYIKQNRVNSKFEDGRYLIQYEGVVEKKSDTEELEKQLARAQEQIDELKMLVALYEEKINL